ncbi:hypothetical protein ACFQY0_00120 [Haloferula chungangensis]|uniref:Uncharacterized protein n=1 Tax=Haloferula chungangensis TaxID=1048331 RepID=A0ABW2L2I5_9BACT
MILTFENFETASLYVAQRRSEGYFARSLDSNCSHLWGPAPVNGARVLVSEEPIDEDSLEAPPLVWSRYLMPALNILTLAWLLSAALILLGLVMKSAQSPLDSRNGALDILVPVLIALFTLCPLVSLFMIWATREDRLRQPGESLRSPMALVTILLLLGDLESPLLYVLLFVLLHF